MAIDRVKLLERLFEITRSLSASVDLEVYLQSILSAGAELTESESASLLEYDEVSLDFSFRSVPWFHREAVSSARVPLSGSIAGWVFLNNESLAIDDVKKDNRHYGKIDDLFDGFQTRSLLGVPLILHGRPVGVFEVFNKKDNYTGEDILIVETLASLASTALQNDLLEKKVMVSQEQARELDKLKNEFIGITSHELRTPLGLILGHSTFLRELVGDEYNEQVDAIIRNAFKLKEIIESLSSVDNYETGGSLVRSRRVSVSRIIEDASLSFQEMARSKGIALKTEVSGGELWVDVDGGKISIALSNILKNALTFSNEGGMVIIRGEQKPEYVTVTVQDTGLGIPAKDLPRIFDRFYQVESHLTRRYGGMGLGLSVAKVMIEMHGGRIWAESKEGEGSTFTFLLPTIKKIEDPPLLSFQ